MRTERDSRPLRREYVLEYRRRGSAWTVRRAARVIFRAALPTVTEPPYAVHAAASPVQSTLAVPITGNGPVVISYVHFLGSVKRSQSDEFIEIVNLGDRDVDVSSWRIEAGAPDQFFLFPDKTVLLARGKVQVYTNAPSDQPGVFRFGSKRALWNDHGDLGRLLDAKGHEVSRYGYGNAELRTVDSILYAHRIPSLCVLAPLPIRQEQEDYRGKIDFLTALERAVRCLIDEPWPQQGQADADGSTQLTEPGLSAANRARLARSTLRLLSRSELPEPAQALLQTSWVFLLESTGHSSMASHQVVIDRSGKKPARQQVGQ